MTRASFAVSTGYMNAFKFVLRISQCITKLNSIMKIFFVSYLPHTGKHGKLLIQIFYSFFVIHPHKDKKHGVMKLLWEEIFYYTNENLITQITRLGFY